MPRSTGPGAAGPLQPGRLARKIKREYEAKSARLRPDMIAGAPSKVLKAVTRAESGSRPHARAEVGSRPARLPVMPSQIGDRPGSVPAAAYRWPGI